MFSFHSRRPFPNFPDLYSTIKWISFESKPLQFSPVLYSCVYKRERWSKKECLYSQCPYGSKKLMHCTLIVSADVQVMKKRSMNPLKTYVRKCQRGTEPEIRVGSGQRRAEASLASTWWRNCVLQLSLFSVCFSFPIFTAEAPLPATNQLPDQDSEPG